MMMFAKRSTRLIVYMSQGERESLTLTALRDTLLPKLISGDLQCHVIDRFVMMVG